MTVYTKPASAGNNIGLPKFGSQPLPALADRQRRKAEAVLPSGLSDGGKLFFHRTHRPVETCNLLAALAGIGQEVHHV
ncbi:MAG TPA: hypothetical protein VGN98_00835 [Tianweitania sediminis]|nr:hypothetical protein [Tianweitania sediminis]